MSAATLNIEKTQAAGERSEAKQTLAPQLRFQEFDGEWENKSMRDFTKINQGLQIPILERFYEKTDDSYFYITNEFLRKGSAKSYFIKNPSESVICYEDDILMTRTGNTGQVVTGVHGAFHNNFFKIKYDKTCSKWFLYYFLTSHKTQHTILKLAGTSTIPDLNHGDFYKITLNTPKLPEQQKIASFLSAVDEKIQQLSHKKELLDQYKKGLMQQLFSGKLRFKDEDGNDYPDWEEKKLGDFKGLIHGDGDWILSENIDADEKYSIIQLGNIGFGKFISKPMKTLSEKNFKIVKGTLIENGDLLINRMVDVNLNACVFKLTGLYVTSVDVCWIRAGNNINNVFFSNLILTEKYQKKLLSLSSGSGRVRISKKNFFDKFYFELPCLEEQQKIADFLSGIDAKIERTNQQITQTQTFKKGLLQQMFV